jgi:hypothetical protein
MELIFFIINGNTITILLSVTGFSFNTSYIRVKIRKCLIS